MSEKYEPKLLGDEISSGILNKFPTLWQKYSSNHSVKHLLLWRYHLEGEYIANTKNHEGTRKLIQNLENNIKREPVLRAQFDKSLQNAHERLSSDNRRMLDSHDKLRSVESEIYHRIEEIQKAEKDELDKISSKKIAICALIVSVLSILSQVGLQFFSNDKMERIKIAELVFENKIKPVQDEISTLKSSAKNNSSRND